MSITPPPPFTPPFAGTGPVNYLVIPLVVLIYCILMLYSVFYCVIIALIVETMLAVLPFAYSEKKLMSLAQKLNKVNVPE